MTVEPVLMSSLCREDLGKRIFATNGVDRLYYGTVISNDGFGAIMPRFSSELTVAPIWGIVFGRTIRQLDGIYSNKESTFYEIMHKTVSREEFLSILKTEYPSHLNWLLFNNHWIGRE